MYVSNANGGANSIMAWHRDGANIAFCDGHVAFMTRNTIPLYRSPTPFLAKEEWIFWTGGDISKKYGDGSF